MYKKSFGSSGPKKTYGGKSGGGHFKRGPSFGRSGGGSRGGGFSRGGGGGRRFTGQRIDVSRFISKATVTEEVKDYSPEHSFATFKIHEKLKQNILNKGYVLPTPIQDKAIPHILLGKDMVGVANTGTGKTAAFLIPFINKILHSSTEQILIVAPTRELATQINDEFIGFARGLGLFSVVCIGGANIHQQISNLRRKHHLIIGTPGRLKDLIERRALSLAKVSNVVLDEADRMLDMGFINDMKYLLAKVAPERQTLLFSATISHEIEGIGRTKHGVEKLSRTLAERGFKAVSIHGDKTHGNRARALKQFKDNQVQILVATDVAARGLDIPDVTHVINYDIPGTYEDYVHRIGRTGRANKKGFALTFVE